MGIQLKLVLSEEKRPYLLDISSFLYDFELLHDFSMILCAEEYTDYKFSRYFWYRYGRPIEPDDRIRTGKIVKESPLIVELILAGVTVSSGALWVMVQAIEKISFWQINKEKLRLEKEKLKKEILQKDLEIKKTQLELEQKVHEREASPILSSLTARFEKNPTKLVDIEMSLTESDDGS